MAEDFKPIPSSVAPAAPADAKKASPFGGGGDQKRKRQKAASEYKKSLVEKQTLRDLYGLSERQFKRYVQESLDKMSRVENVSDELIKVLERRLDNVVFRLGFAKSRRHARQLVSHAYFMINGKPVNIPSYQVIKGDVVALKEAKKKKDMYKELGATLKKAEAPMWLKLDAAKFEAKTVGEPSIAEVNPPVEISLIFEFYSR